MPFTFPFGGVVTISVPKLAKLTSERRTTSPNPLDSIFHFAAEQLRLGEGEGDKGSTCCHRAYPNLLPVSHLRLIIPDVRVPAGSK